MLDESVISYFYLKESPRNDNIRNNPVYLTQKDCFDYYLFILIG